MVVPHSKLASPTSCLCDVAVFDVLGVNSAAFEAEEKCATCSELGTDNPEASRLAAEYAAAQTCIELRSLGPSILLGSRLAEGSFKTSYQGTSVEDGPPAVVSGLTCIRKI